LFTTVHWDELTRRGYTVVSGAIDEPMLGAAQAAARHLNAIHPDGGWERTRNELWREVRYCRAPEFMAIATQVLDPLAREIVEEGAPPVDFVQFASTMPGFSTKGGIGRHFHIDGGKDRALDVFNVLFGVALTPIDSDTAGGFHLLPRSHEAFSAAFRRQPANEIVHWGNAKLEAEREVHKGAHMVVPRLAAGDIVVTHSFVAHGTSANTTDTRRDMLFQRRAATALCDPARRDAAREAFMRDPWTLFRQKMESRA